MLVKSCHFSPDLRNRLEGNSFPAIRHGAGDCADDNAPDNHPLCHPSASAAFPMKRSLATSVRAHFVLLAVSLLIAAVPGCALYVMFDLFDAGEPPTNVRAALVLLALAVTLALRLFGLRAFRAAYATGHVRLHGPGEDGTSIKLYCEHRWFVQLHLELMGYDGID